MQHSCAYVVTERRSARTPDRASTEGSARSGERAGARLADWPWRPRAPAPFSRSSRGPPMPHDAHATQRHPAHGAAVPAARSGRLRATDPPAFHPAAGRQPLVHDTTPDLLAADLPPDVPAAQTPAEPPAGSGPSDPAEHPAAVSGLPDPAEPSAGSGSSDPAGACGSASLRPMDGTAAAPLGAPDGRRGYVWADLVT
jgi:hypothetical protein